MCPVRGPVVEESDTFEQDCSTLEEDYPELERVLEVLKDTLRLGYALPHVQAAPDDYHREYPNVHAVFLDYPPAGPDGKKAFLVTYHLDGQRHGNPMQAPSSTFTLLSIADRN